MGEFDAARNLYDRLSGFYDLLAGKTESRARDAGLELLAVRPGESVLEIGFGTGRAMLQLARTAGPDGEVQGVDISPGMTEVARQTLTRAGISTNDRGSDSRAATGAAATSARVNTSEAGGGHPAPVLLTTAAVPPLPYESGTFNAVFASFTLELYAVDVIPHVLAEVSRVLAPSGRLGLVCMATRPEGENPTLMERLYVRLHQKWPTTFDCRPIDLPSWLADSGFTITSSTRLSLWGLPVLACVCRH